MLDFMLINCSPLSEQGEDNEPLVLLHNGITINYFANHKGMVMNYEDKSDFEINKAVAKILRPDLTPISECDSFNARGDDNEVHFLRFGFYLDYCNNPSDAWPIITENRIDTYCLHSGIWRASNDVNGWLSSDDTNPLRAAMIVFLKMEQDND